MRPIVVGYSGTEASLDGLALGATLAGARRAHLIALYVDRDDHRFSQVDFESQADLRTRLAKLHELAEPVLERLGSHFEVRAIGGVSAPRALHEFARDERAGLVVVGSSKAGPIRRVTLGSTAGRLFVEASCPVAVAPRGFAKHAERSITTVGVAVDGTPGSDASLAEATAIARDAGAELTPITVEPGAGAPTRRVARALAEASEALDLLVVGAREPGGLRHLGIGSVSRRLLPTSTSALVVVPEGVGR